MIYDKKLYDALDIIEKKYQELLKKSEELDLPFSQLKEIKKQIKTSQLISEKFNIYKNVIQNTNDAEKLIETEKKNSDMYELAQLELQDGKEKIEKLEIELKILLIPVDPNDEKNITIEMRPAAGGDEASIFVSDLFETYKAFASLQGWTVDIIEISTNAFGYDYIYFNVVGKNVYSKMKYESGVHRVQRVPETESKGRVHTSTITVAVMPEVNELELNIKPDDLIVEVCRASGAGGQHVNRTNSAVRIVHIPTGIAAACSNERSQLMNKDKAMKLLYSKIWSKMKNERDNEISSARKNQVGTGDRSEKIRTYNYPQNRITDHRIGLTINNLEKIMQGYLDEIIENLISDEQSKKISSLGI